MMRTLIDKNSGEENKGGNTIANRLCREIIVCEFKHGRNSGRGAQGGGGESEQKFFMIECPREQTP